MLDFPTRRAHSIGSRISAQFYSGIFAFDQLLRIFRSKVAQSLPDPGFRDPGFWVRARVFRFRSALRSVPGSSGYSNSRVRARVRSELFRVNARIRARVRSRVLRVNSRARARVRAQVLPGQRLGPRPGSLLGLPGQLAGPRPGPRSGSSGSTPGSAMV
eukprot:1191301-Prorocentrum_minimum.AAC.6